MRRLFSSLLLCTLAGCAANPADDKPKAEVSAAPAPSPASASASAPAGEAAAAAPAPEKAFADAVEIDKQKGAAPVSAENMRIEFVGSKVTGSHAGGFKTFRGAILGPDPDHPEVPLRALDVEVDVDSMYSDNNNLTSHLKGADFLDAAKYPKAYFLLAGVEGEKGSATHKLSGSLTMHGVTKSITFPATVEVKDGRIHVASEFSINRKDFGIAYAGKADDLIRDEVVMKIDVNTALKSKDAP